MAELGWSTDKTTTILQVFREALARSGPDFPFLDFAGITYTLGELDIRSDALARGLRAAGAEAGQCVSSLLDNSVEQTLLLFACSKIGAIHVPLNTAYKGEYLRHQLADSGAVVLVAEPDYAERIAVIEEGLPDARVLFVRDGAPGFAGKLDIRTLDDAYLDDGSPLDHAVKPGDIAMLIYTAGTTGPSKGCMVSQNYVCNMARQIGEALGYGPSDVIWTPLPGFHLNQYTATIVAALRVGARAAVYRRFSVSNYWPEIERTGATVSQILSTMVTLIAEATDNDAMKRCYGQLRVAGGVPFPESVQKVWRERFGVKTIGNVGYGLTECAIVVSVDANVPRPSASSGARNDDFDVRIVDDEDRELPPGTPGEIIVRPKKPHVMFEGYWRRSDETIKLLRNYWFHTGDIGMFDEDGWFFFMDRKKDYLRRRGENISSMEVEAVFRAHPAIAEVAVHAVIADMEDDLKVTAILVEGVVLEPEVLCRWSVDNLPYFAVPRFIEFRLELPKNPVGRVLKYELRDQGVTATTWDREKSGFELAKR